MKKILSFLAFILISFSLFAESIENEYCSFTLPSRMELQQGLYGEIASSLNLYDDGALYSAVLQQKGLNTFDEDAYSDYARITISCMEDSPFKGHALKAEELSEVDSAMYDLMSSLYVIAEWKDLRVTTFKGYTAYVLEYTRRSVTGKGDVKVYSLFVDRTTESWNIIFAARKENLERWIPSFREFGESFVFKESVDNDKKQEVSIQKYPVKGTSQSFYWYSTPNWIEEYIEGERVHAFFADEENINLSIVVMDLGRTLSKKASKNSFLALTQQQITQTVREEMADLNLRVLENFVDTSNSIYIYRYTCSMYDRRAEGVIAYSFSGSKCVVYTAEWLQGDDAAANIVNQYVSSLR